MHTSRLNIPATKLRADRQSLLAAVAQALPEIQEGARHLDESAQFPERNFERLRAIGAFTATLPESLGGLGFGYGAQGAEALLQLLMLLGEASLPVARLYEAHVNALQLACRYGRETLASRAARDAADGHLFALWVTDPPSGALTLRPDFILEGGKAFCSGAGVATRALVTAQTAAGAQMLVLPVPPLRKSLPSKIKLAGMRAATTGSVDFAGMRVSPEDLLGLPGDYLREPVFSAGAWRSAAAALGGLAALVKLHRNEILNRRRDADPHQQARFGQLMIAYETSLLWMREAAQRACLEDGTDDAIVAYISLSRLAVETACLDAMRLTQRSLGLSAFMAGHPAERLCRDLATYLRQPAPDETLTKAAGYYLHRPPNPVMPAKAGIHDFLANARIEP
jgi:alkylation response protein AidB-like acyl-CoA dehydrogenase